MSETQAVQIFLEPDLRKSAEAGAHNFIGKMQHVLENARFRVEFCDTGTPAHSTHSLIHMKPPVSTKGLVFRRAYHYPFWQIEQMAERWDWDVARADFDPDQIDGQEARRFAGFWRKRLFGDVETSTKGYVYVPLQGRLLAQRSFQACSPIEMIEATVAHSGTRKVIAALHPKEIYHPKEIDALERLELKNHRFSVARGDMERLLAGCDYVVTQNSGVAYSGYFLGKAALLFGKIDFHHIAVKADMDDLQQSFDAVAAQSPRFAEYVWWFWQDQSINAGRPEAEQKIADRFRRFGWIK